jgi:hypothetical protein
MASDWVLSILTGLLVLITGYYAFQTWRLAVAAKAQADSNTTMAAEMREQRYERYRPIVVIQESGWQRSSKGYQMVEATMTNVGSGPALELSFSLETEEARLLPHPLVEEEIVDKFGEL